ncbi:MAG: hypothetical protein NNA18_02965 [Nitrospira sp.]|nr:hypothetical protein [Nitrospira sp.]
MMIMEMMPEGLVRGPDYHHDSAESEEPSGGEADSHPKKVLGRGVFRFLSRGGSLANRSMRSWFMADAFISAKPGLRVPTIFDEKEESNLVACLAWHEGHSVSSMRS